MSQSNTYTRYQDYIRRYPCKAAPDSTEYALHHTKAFHCAACDPTVQRPQGRLSYRQWLAHSGVGVAIAACAHEETNRQELSRKFGAFIRQHNAKQANLTTEWSPPSEEELRLFFSRA